MKNILKVLALSAITLGALVGCDDKKSSNASVSSKDIASSVITSSDSSSSATPSSNIASSSNKPSSSVAPSSNSSTSSSIPTKTAWTDEETKTMSDNLYGVVLPFTGFDESVVFYDDQDEKVYVYGGAKNDAFLDNYHTKLASLGFVDYQVVPGLSIAMEKEVSTANGVKHVYVYVTFSNNQLYIEAYDPYYYTFPTAFVRDMAYELFTSDDIVPAITADFYEADENQICVTCYYQSTLADGGYNAVLTAANWDVQANVDDEGFYTAISPKRYYQIAYKYAEGKLKIYIEPLFFWNSDLITGFFNKYNGTVVAIPAFDVEGAQYQFAESKNNQAYYQAGELEAIHSFMYIYGATAANLATYTGLLQTNGWDIEDVEGFYYASLTIPNKGVARMELEYSEVKGCVVFTFYFMLDPIPLAEWPAEEIAGLLGGYQQDVLPSFNEENKGFTILNDLFGTAIMVHVARNSEDAAMNEYIETLIANKYTQLDEEEYGQDHFISENEEIIVYVYRGTRGSITIAFEAAPMTKFPSAYIQNLFVAKKDTVPALDGATLYECSIDAPNSTLNITCNFESASLAASAFSQYDSTLTGANYTFSGEYFGSRFYSSKNNEFDISLQLNDKAVIVGVTGTFAKDISLWPADDIAALFQAKGFTDPLPEYEENCDAITADVDYSNNIFVLFETSKITTVKSNYIKLLKAAGFTYDSINSTDYDDVYKSPSSQYQVWVSTNRFGVALTIKSLGGSQQGGSTFPAEEVYSYFPSAQNVLPILVDENAEFEAEYYASDKSFSICVTYETQVLAEEGFNTYIGQLKTAGFTEQKVWNGSVTIYRSPDSSFIVWVMDYYLSSGEFYIDIYPGNTDYFSLK